MTFLQAVSSGPKLYRMFKGPGNLGGIGNAYAIVKDMAVDPETPSEMFIDDALVIDYDMEPYTALVYGQIKWSGGNTPRVNCRLVRNGSVLVTGAEVRNSSQLATASATVTVQPGDSFELWWRGEGNFFMRPTLQAGQDTFLHIEPI